MRILKFLFLLPLLAIDAQALEPKVVMKPGEPKKRALLRKRQALRRHAKDASIQRRGPI